jgi:hypothetical protein
MTIDDDYDQRHQHQLRKVVDTTNLKLEILSLY